MLVLPRPLTSTSRHISQQIDTSWKAVIMAAPVSDISAELVGSSEIYAAAVGLTDTCSTQRQGRQHRWEAMFLSVLVMLGWMNIMRCHKNRNKLFLPDILEQSIHRDFKMFHCGRMNHRLQVIMLLKGAII